MTQVEMQDVMRWLLAALDAAREDPGNGNGTVTALSHRRLEFTSAASPGQVRVEVITWNREFTGGGRREYSRLTSDGVEVRWNDDDQSIPTGTDWLPVRFVEWMKGGETE